MCACGCGVDVVCDCLRVGFVCCVFIDYCSVCVWLGLLLCRCCVWCVCVCLLCVLFVVVLLYVVVDLLIVRVLLNVLCVCSVYVV